MMSDYVTCADCGGKAARKAVHGLCRTCYHDAKMAARRQEVDGKWLCSRCGSHKPKEEFKQKSIWCAACRTEYNTTATRALRSKDITSADRSRDARYRRDFGITAAEYDQMLEHQEGVCAICGRPPKNIRLAVDHDHKTGEVRGLLCFGCNRRLSHQVDEFWLFAAYEYLDTPPVHDALGRTPVGVKGTVVRKSKRRRRRP